MPGQIFSGVSRGTHSLINQGATLINSVDDLLDALPQDYTKVLGGESPEATHQPPVSKQPDKIARPQSVEKRSTPTPQPKANLNLTPEEQTVLSAMDADSVHIDEITRVTQLPIGKVSSLLGHA